MFQNIFTQIGLTKNEAVVYDFLIKIGEATAGEIIKKTPLKRGVVYNALTDLVKKGVVTEKKKNKVAFFIPNHPEKLRECLLDKESSVKNAKNTLDANLPDIVSSFNLVSGQPGVRYFEGVEGIKKVINDTFTSKETIYTYADIKSINKYIKKINDAYAKKRDKLNLKKKIIFVDSKFSRKYLKTYHTKTTEARLIPASKNFGSIMQIYSGKISYITLTEKNKIGVIIEDKSIYEMHRMLFESVWNNAKKIN